MILDLSQSKMSLAEIKEHLRKKEHIDCAELYQNGENEVNKEQPYFVDRLRLLHEVVDSPQLCNVQNIECLFKLGADPTEKQINEDTALHMAVQQQKVDIDIIRALVNSQHGESAECRMNGKPCICGKKALLVSNNRQKTPRQLDYISDEVLSFLNMEELILAIHNASISPNDKDTTGFKNVHQVLKKIGRTLPDDFSQELLNLLLKLEGDHHFWVLPMLSYLLTVNNLDEIACMAIDKPKWQTYYMAKSLIKIKRCHPLSTVVEKDNFIHTWHQIFKFNEEKKELECLDNDLRYPETKERRDNKEEYLKFIKNEKVLKYLISVAANNLLEDKTVLYLLITKSLLHDLKEMKEYILNWNRLGLRNLDLSDQELQCFHDKTTWIDLNNNSLKVIPKMPRSNQWKSLTYINLEGNKLENIGPEIFTLKPLQRINLKNNQIKFLPNIDKFAETLTCLELSKNFLTNLPKALAKSSITSLYLAENKFESLPLSICEMPLTYLDLSGNKNIIDFPIDLGRLIRSDSQSSPNLKIDDMNQLCYPQNMIEKPRLLLAYLRSEFLKTSIRNQEMNLMFVGPVSEWNRILSANLLNEKVTPIDDENNEIKFPSHDGYSLKYKSIKMSLQSLQYQLKPVIFPGQLDWTQVFLTNRSLYLVVWVEGSPSVLKEWLNCLVSYAPDSLIMIVKIHRFQTDDSTENVENSINSVVENNDKQSLIGQLRVEKTKIKREKKRKRDISNRCQTELITFLDKEFKPSRNLHFGKWKGNNNSSLNEFWFNYIDMNDAKDIKKLRENIWEVALSLPVNFENKNEDRILGWKIPKFYFALDEKIKENAKRKDKRIATISIQDVRDEIQRFDRQQDCNSPAILVNCLLDEDICEMLQFLKDTGHLMYFHKVNQKLNEVVILNFKPLQKLLKTLKDGHRTDPNMKELSREDLKQIMKDVTVDAISNDSHDNDENVLLAVDHVISLVENFKIGFNISENQICFHLGMEYYQQSYQGALHLKEKFNRVFTFECLPFGFWKKLLSRLSLYTNGIVNNDESPYSNYMNPKVTNSSPGEAYRQSFVYYQEEVVFIKIQILESRENDNSHPWIQKFEDIDRKEKVLVFIRGSERAKTCRIFTELIHHIETSIGDYPESTLKPFEDVRRWTRCPSCQYNRQGKVFGMEDCFKQCQENLEEKSFECPPCRKRWLMKDLFPDMVFADVPEILLPSCHVSADVDWSNAIEGGFGLVCRSTLTPCNRDHSALKVALKKQKVPFDDVNPMEIFFAFRHESVLSYKLADHPYIVTFLGIQRQQRITVTEWADEGSLSDRMKEGQSSFSRLLLYRIFFQISDALNFMHSLHISHRDLHAGNIFFFTEDTNIDTNVKLADFGVSVFANGRVLQEKIGMEKYRPPELFLFDSTYTASAVDIYAVGLNMYRALTFMKLFNGFLTQNLGLKKLMKKKEDFDKAFQFDQVRQDAICLKRMMRACIQYHPNDRVNDIKCIVYLLKHPCFQLLMNSIPLTTSPSYEMIMTKRFDSSTNLVKDQVHFVYAKENRDSNDITIRIRTVAGMDHIRKEGQKNVNDSREDLLTLIGDFTKDEMEFQSIQYDDLNMIVCIKLKDRFKIVLVPRGEKNKLSREYNTTMDDMIEGRFRKMQCLQNQLFVLYDDCTGEKTKTLITHGSFEPNLPEADNPTSTILSSVSFNIDFPEVKAIQLYELRANKAIKELDVKDFVADSRFLVLTIKQATQFFILSFYQEGALLLQEKYITEDIGCEIKRMFLHNDKLIFVAAGEGKKVKILIYHISQAEKSDVYQIDIDTKKECNFSGLYTGPIDITSFCHANGTYWFGTHTGYIFIVSQIDGQLYSTPMKPYTSPVTDLILAENNVVLSYGKTLDKDAFTYSYNDSPGFPRESRVYEVLLEKWFQLNRDFLEVRYKEKPVCHDFASDLLLVWDAPNSKDLARYQMKRTKGSATNEKLKRVRDHKKECGNKDRLHPENSNVVQGAKSIAVQGANSNVVQGANSNAVQETNSNAVQETNSNAVQQVNSDVIQEKNSNEVQGANLTRSPTNRIPNPCTDQSAFTSILQQRGLKIYKVKGDGNCFFRAISHQLYDGDDSQYAHIRSKAITHILKNVDNFTGFLADGENILPYIQRMTQDGAYTDNLIIQATANAFEIAIDVINSNQVQYPGTREIRLPEGIPPRKRVVLGHYDQNHFDSTVPI